MMYWLCKESGQHPNRQQLEHVIRRNFGGSETVNCMDIFSKYLHILKENNQIKLPKGGIEVSGMLLSNCLKSVQSVHKKLTMRWLLHEDI